MVEYGGMSNSLYELQASKWEWKKLQQKKEILKNGEKGEIPCARMCHSFTTLGDGKVVLFGGVKNGSDAPDRIFNPIYLDDVFYLELNSQTGVKHWSKPSFTGTGPSARESHSALVYRIG